MACKHHRMLIVGQHGFHVFSETARCPFDRLPGKFMQSFRTAKRTSYGATPRNVECEVLSAGTEVSVHITAPERGVRLSDGRFKRVRHISLPPSGGVYGRRQPEVYLGHLPIRAFCDGPEGHLPAVFDPGYGQEPFRTLGQDVPDATVFPFRTEWAGVPSRGARW